MLPDDFLMHFDASWWFFDAFWCFLMIFWCVLMLLDYFLMHFDAPWWFLDAFWCFLMIFWCILMLLDDFLMRFDASWWFFDAFWCLLMIFWCILMLVDDFGLFSCKSGVPWERHVESVPSPWKQDHVVSTCAFLGRTTMQWRLAHANENLEREVMVFCSIDFASQPVTKICKTLGLANSQTNLKSFGRHFWQAITFELSKHLQTVWGLKILMSHFDWADFVLSSSLQLGQASLGRSSPWEGTVSLLLMPYTVPNPLESWGPHQGPNQGSTQGPNQGPDRCRSNPLQPLTFPAMLWNYRQSWTWNQELWTRREVRLIFSSFYNFKYILIWRGLNVVSDLKKLAWV